MPALSQHRAEPDENKVWERTRNAAGPKRGRGRKKGSHWLQMRTGTHNNNTTVNPSSA